MLVVQKNVQLIAVSVKPKIYTQQWHEDGQAKSCGFEHAHLLQIVVADTLSWALFARHLCPAFTFSKKT